MKKFKQILFIFSWHIAGVVLLSSCLPVKKTLLLQDQGAAVNNFENAKKISYQIQTGDHLYIKVYSLDPKTSKLFQTDMPTVMNTTYQYLNSYLVDEEGYIDFSFVDKLFVKGLTIDDVRKKIQNTMNEYFKETTVVVKLVDFQISVMGEVGSPGNFTINKDQINILQAISEAGGPKEFADLKRITLIRQNLKGSEIHYVNINDKKILASEFYYLKPNDIIYVEPLKGKGYLVTRLPYTSVLSFISFGVSMALLFKLIK
jgi:polysaccharide biosynthesis/export protein